MNIEAILPLQETFQKASDTFFDATEFDLDEQNQQDFMALFFRQLGQWQQMSEQASTLELTGLFDIIELFSEALSEWINQDQLIDDETWEALDNWYSHFSLIFDQSTLIEASAQLIHCLQNDCWQIDLDDETAAELLISLFSTDLEEPREFMPPAGTAPAAEELPAKPDIEANVARVQAKLVNLISTEFSFFLAEFSQCLDKAVITNEASYQSVISNKLRKFDNLQEACVVVGLVGLQMVLQHIQQGLKQPFTVDFDYQLEARLLKSSLLLIQDYLDHVDQIEKAQVLVTFLQMEGRRTIATSQQAEQWLALLTVIIDRHQEETSSKRIIAKAEDVSLNISSDVNTDVLETTLHELPLLSTRFHQAITSLITEGAHKDTLLQAQRIAHTLKGTAGIIGISGIMELTHHLEAILEKLSETNSRPPVALAELFQESADCLENMCETVCGESPPPSNSLALLQSIMDWAYQVDKEGIPESSPAILEYVTEVDKGLAVTDTSLPVTEPSTPQKVLEKTAVASVFIDELLQSLSEGSIVNGQLKGTVDTLITNTKQVREMSWKLHEFSAELDRQINTRNYVARQKNSLFDSLEMDQYNELHHYVNRIAEVSADVREMNIGMSHQLNNLKTMLLEQGVMQKENLDIVREVRLVPVEKITSRCQRIVRQTAKLTNKDTHLNMLGTQTLIDNDTLNKLVEPLMHLLRNAVDHGIESPDIRLAAGKSTQGNLTLSFAQRGNFVYVSCSDDGQGLNREKIIQTAIRKGLIKEDDNIQITENELSRLILTPGFSTRETSTQVSGRGLGMDVIHSQVIAMKGVMNIISTPLHGMQVNITLPLLLAASQAILVRVGTTVYAIAEQGVQQMFASGHTKIVEHDGQPYYRYEDHDYAVEHLSTLLGQPTDIDINSVKKPAILVTDRTGEQTIVFVDTILGSQDLIIKSFGDYVANIPGVLGAAILGNGELACVLDVYELLSVKHEYHFDTSAIIMPEPSLSLPKIIVIDDSLSARKATSQFMSVNGFEVETAIDGVDGLNKIEEKTPDLILVDMEMPRMDGLELTAHIRNREDTASIPIIMITSRTTQKHRAQASEAGVSKYLTKPFTEDDLINAVDEVLSTT